MSHFTPFRSQWIAVLCVLLIFAPILWDLPQASSAEPVQRYDGVTLYRGIFFGYGPVADKIPEVRDHLKLEYFLTDPVMMNGFITLYNRVMGEIRRIDPNFFNDFALAMQSGDYLLIQEMIQYAGQITLAAAQRIPMLQMRVRRLQKNPEPLKAAIAKYNAEVPPEQQIDDATIAQAIDLLAAGGSSDLQAATVSGALCIFYVWVVVLVDVVAVTSAALAISLWLSCGVERYIAGPATQIAGKEEMLYEQMVHSIATNLAV